MKDQLDSLRLQISSMAFFKSPFFLKYNRLIIPGIVLILSLLIIFLWLEQAAQAMHIARNRIDFFMIRIGLI